MLDHLNHLHFARTSKQSALRDIILVREVVTPLEGFMSYSDFISQGDGIPLRTIDALESQVDPHETCNIQFTSGTTSSPKASMLTH
jgi:long-subunit acyl-CoA synthetase (AMP-forming)